MPKYTRRKILRTGAIGFGIALASRASAMTDIVTGDFEFYATTWKNGDRRKHRDVPPPNKWLFINNTYGRGDLVNGHDFTCILKANQSEFPKGASIEWDFRQGGGSGIGPFAYGYPALMYGGNPWGNEFGVKGPWPQRIADCQILTIDYDVKIGGNANSFNLLLDLYATEAPHSRDGSSTGEMSFFPYANADLPFVNGGEVMDLSFGECRVGIQGKQMCFEPSSSGGRYRRPILSGKIDLLELFRICVAKGWVLDRHYLRGAEFGAEIQVPAAYNSPPYTGSLLFKKAPVWTWI